MDPSSRTSIGRTTKVVGHVSGDGDLLIEGRLEGELRVAGQVHVAEGGSVTAPVHVDGLTVEGDLEGDVEARGAVVIRAKGSVRGELRVPQVALEEGARFHGHIEMDVLLPDELVAEVGEG